MQRNHSHQGERSLWDRIWRDAHGKVAVWQTPNLLLIAWAVFTTLSLFVNGRLADIFSWIALAALIVWSLLEIVKGDSYFRRVLGLLVLFFALMSLVRAV